MANNPPPPPPDRSTEQSGGAGTEPNIADMRDAFTRKQPLSEEEIAAARTFIDNKIEMVESDPHLTPQQKADAVTALKAKRP